ncbi:hypothetical protein [Hydrogenivirga sp. 128-5-R1-1]|uniref:hypothetical protein n=1 Tax=Hydrogenivirga sp. 128-5-R1-1 TaxID=392423 RepID=UPI00015F18AF|nr:hypothetical protein [Hydrogenivirga sp. 128-5-R1-1]EDP75381.1 hypothetical protein HG1285_15491 [Hydrogenivirga sp. 128-5-R1-1]
MEELARTLTLFEGSDLLFMSYGREKDGEYLPHSEALRVTPELLTEAVKSTPLQPNDFGIMPFKWKAKSEEDITYMLLERKLSRWTEGELFSHGYILIDRVLVDVDFEELSEEDALKKAQELKKKGIGKVGYTGGGLLVVLELDDAVKVEDRETFRSIREKLLKGVRKVLGKFDESSFNLGKGVRLIGTRSRKRGTDTKWLIWEEGKKFDLCELVLGVKREVLSQAPVGLKNSLREKFGIELKGSVKKVTPEEVFKRAREFYGELDGQRNDFMLGLAGEMYSAGVDKEEVIELYYEHLSDLEKRERPHTRIKQTIEWVYKEGKTYSLKGDYPSDFLSLVKSLRGEEVSLSWRDFGKAVPPSLFVELLKLSGEEVYEDHRGIFHLPSGFLYSTMRATYVVEDEDGKKREEKGETKVGVILELPPCLERALREYSTVENGETEWYVTNLLYTAFMMPSSSWEVLYSDFPLKELTDNPYAEAVVLMTTCKGIGRGEIKTTKAKKKVEGSDALWGLVRCSNPLLKRHCTETCPYYRFRDSLPRVENKRVDVRTGDVVKAEVVIEGDRIEVDGKVLSSFKTFSSYLEKRGHFLSQIAREWLYVEAVKFSCAEYVDEEKERTLGEMKEVLEVYGSVFIETVKDGYLWIRGEKFIDLLREIGISAGRRNVGEIRKNLGFLVKRRAAGNYTLIPVSTFPEESVKTMFAHVGDRLAIQLFVENVPVETKESLTEEELADEDYVLGRKAYVVVNKERVRLYYMGQEKDVEDPYEVRMWVKQLQKSNPVL